MEYAVEFPKYTGINNHIIELKKGKQPLFGPIYSLEYVTLEILKTYIETNLANDFIWLFKSPAKTLILFNWKLNRIFPLCIND